MFSATLQILERKTTHLCVLNCVHFKTSSIFLQLIRANLTGELSKGFRNLIGTTGIFTGSCRFGVQ